MSAFDETTIEMAWGLAPVLGLSALVLILLLSATFSRARDPGFQQPLALLGLSGCCWLAGSRIGDERLDGGLEILTKTFIVDHLTVLFDLMIVVVLLCAVAIRVRSSDSKMRPVGRPSTTFDGGEAEPLVVLAGLGAMLAVHAGTLSLIFFGLELMTFASVVLLLVSRSSESLRDTICSDEGRRVLLWSMAVTAITLMGIAMIYSAIATLEINALGSRVAVAFNRWGAAQPYIKLIEDGPVSGHGTVPAGLLTQAKGKVVVGMAPVSMFLPGLLLLLAGILARIGVVPFVVPGSHPRRGSELQLTVLFTLMSGLAVVGVFLRLFVAKFNAPHLVRDPYGWTAVVVTLGLATAFVGSIRSLRSRSLVRIAVGLAQGQLGMLLTMSAVAAGFYGHRRASVGQISSPVELDWARIAGDDSVMAILLALVVYVLSSLGLFCAIRSCSSPTGGVATLVAWSGLGRRRPLFGLALALVLIAMAGLPPTIGMLSRVAILRSVSQHSSFGTTALLMVAAMLLISLGSLRVVWTLYRRDWQESVGSRPAPADLILYVASATLLVGSLYGEGLVQWCRLSATGMSINSGTTGKALWSRPRRGGPFELSADLGSEVKIEPLNEIEGGLH